MVMVHAWYMHTVRNNYSRQIKRLKLDCCWPSAAAEEWYSPKRPSSTVVIQHTVLYVEVSTILIFILVCDMMHIHHITH